MHCFQIQHLSFGAAVVASVVDQCTVFVNGRIGHAALRIAGIQDQDVL